jgi:hypothetical protein
VWFTIKRQVKIGVKSASCDAQILQACAKKFEELAVLVILELRIPLRGFTRRLFNYLVPMLQDKRPKEEEGKGGQQAELNKPEKGAASGCAEDGMLG